MATNSPSSSDLDQKEVQQTDTSASSTISNSTDDDVQVPTAQPQDSEKATAAAWSHDFPDGGREAWTTVLGGFFSVFVSFGWIVCIGSFQSYYQTHQLREYPPSKIAWIPSTEVAMMFFGSPFFGAVFDHFGPKPLLFGGLLLHVFGLMMTSLAKEYYQFLLAQSICSGLGASSLFLAANNSVGTWFNKKRGLAFGLTASGSSLAGSILPVMIDRLIPRIGFAWTMRVVAFIFLALSLVACVTVKSRMKPHPTPRTLKSFLAPLLYERPYQLNTAACFFFFWGLFIPFNFLVLQARRDAGMSNRLSTLLVTILNASSLPGRIILPAFADKVGRFNMVVVVTLICSILTLGLWTSAKTNASIIAYAVTYGVFSGSYVSLMPTVLVQLTPNIRELGARVGLSMMFISIAVLTGNPIAGALVQKANGGYLYLQIWAGVCMTIGTVLFLATRFTLKGLKLAKV